MQVVQLTASDGNSTGTRSGNLSDDSLDLVKGLGKSGKLGQSGSSSTQKSAGGQVAGEVGEVAKLVLESLKQQEELLGGDLSSGNSRDDRDETGNGGEAADRGESEAAAGQATGDTAENVEAGNTVGKGQAVH